eukprot:Skav218988  [mRNA]  locus=scaffold169:91567:99824:+ [translate_table: standard]
MCSKLGAILGSAVLPGARDWLGMRDYYSFVRAVRDGCLKQKVEQPNAESLPSTESEQHFVAAAGVLPESPEILLGSDFPEDASEEGEIELMLRLAIGARSQLCPMAESFKLLVLVDQAGRPLLDELRSWCRSCAAEAACEVVPGGLELGSVLAALMLARPNAQLEDGDFHGVAGELQRAIFDMALPLAVFRSKTLQEMQRREEEYFEAGWEGEFQEVRRSLCDAMRYAIDAHNSDLGDGRGLLCDVATSSPMAHMPPLKELATVGGWEHE